MGHRISQRDIQGAVVLDQAPMPVVRYQLRHRAEGQRLGEAKLPILMVDPDEFVGAIAPVGISHTQPSL